MGKKIRDERRSGCPINLTLEVLGDKWTLLVIRDIVFGNRRHFREILTKSEERIASNVLADRLQRLVRHGLITKSEDETHRQKILYSLAEPGIQLVPVLAQIGSWGRRFLPVSGELAIRAEILEKGGPRMWERFIAELRESHLGKPNRRSRPSVRLELQRAYETVRRKRTSF